MPGCLPFDLPRPRSNKLRLRRSIKISAPMPRPSASLHLGTPSVAENAPPKTHAEQANFYLVPNKSGTGKNIVRRRVPPPPISPTLEGILSSPPVASTSKATEMTSANNKRPTLAIRTTSPLTELNDGSTARTLTPKPRFDPMRSFRNSFRSRQNENDYPSMSGPRWKGKEKAVVADEVEETKENKVAAKAREIRAWMMGKSGSDIHHSMTYPDPKQDKAETSYATRTRHTVGGLFKNRHRDTSRTDRGPKPGQTYEIVNRRIVENSPEKTVEISTWREHAPKQVNDDEDKMSIYYINADEYPMEGDFANDAGPKVEWRMEGSVVSQTDKLGSNTGSSSLPYCSHPAEINTPQVGKQQHRSKSPQKQTMTSRDGTISPSTSEKDPEPEQQAPNAKTTKVADRKASGSRQSTSRRRGRYKESTPIEKDLPKSPFHPTQSGSTISSIRSQATLEFETILTSCEPSLLHVSPILKSLGIRRIEHLKAVARLTPNTRDREVKEDALRLGMTIVEWAILLDKIFTL